jgi:hypothetical protein
MTGIASSDGRHGRPLETDPQKIDTNQPSDKEPFHTTDPKNCILSFHIKVANCRNAIHILLTLKDNATMLQLRNRGEFIHLILKTETEASVETYMYVSSQIINKMTRPQVRYIR